MSEQTVVKKRGGYRGGGRKKAPDNFRRHGVLVSDEDWALFQRLGEGNASRGLGYIAQAYRDQQPGQKWMACADLLGKNSDMELGVSPDITDEDILVIAETIETDANAQGIYFSDSLTDYLKNRRQSAGQETGQ